MCVYAFSMLNIENMIYILILLVLFSLIAMRESPVKRRSRLSKMMPGGEKDKEILPTPITIRNDRGGLHTSPIQRRSYDITPLTSNQSDTRY